MNTSLHRAFGKTALSLALAACLASEAYAKKKSVPVIAPSDKKEVPAAKGQSGKNPPPATGAAKPDETFQEINFGKALVIEGKVEKPQVQFTLLKEPPPEKEIRFETSFLQNILKLDRENTFKPGERYGRE